MRTYQNQCIFIIRWDGGAKDTYLYGTELDWNRQGPIRFANRFLPSGQAIRTWSSAWTYQRDRVEAQLPVLEEGKAYQLRTFLRDDPEGTVLLRLRFFDRYGEQCAFFVSEHRMDRFVCPAGTSSPFGRGAGKDHTGSCHPRGRKPDDPAPGAAGPAAGPSGGVSSDAVSRPGCHPRGGDLPGGADPGLSEGGDCDLRRKDKERRGADRGLSSRCRAPRV